MRTILDFDPRWIAMQTLWNRGWANIYDPFPSVQAAELLASNERASVYVELARKGSSFIYPPIAAVLYTPFVGLSWRTVEVRLAWVSRSLFVSIFVVILLFVAHGKKRLSALHVASIAATMVCFYPLLRAVKLNQSTLFVTLFLGLGWLAVRKRADAWAGVFLAAAIAIKPHLALMLPILAWQAKKTVLSTLVTTTLLVVASLFYAGWDNHVDYVSRVLPSLTAGYAFHPNQSWNALFLRLFTKQAINIFEIAPPSAIIQGLAVLGALLTYGGAVLTSWRVRRHSELAPQMLGFAWLAATLASPIAWEHHYAPAIFVFVTCWDVYSQHGSNLPKRLLPAFAASFVCIASYFEVFAWTGVAARLLASYVFFGGLLLFVACAALLLAQGSHNTTATGNQTP